MRWSWCSTEFIKAVGSLSKESTEGLNDYQAITTVENGSTEDLNDVRSHDDG
jgi:hypothetical protein